MIGRLAGIIAHRGPDHVVIDVRGVGYVVHVSERALSALPPVGQAAALWTELLVREDLLQLFGVLLCCCSRRSSRICASLGGAGLLAMHELRALLRHSGTTEEEA